jgi:tRNA A-37 threonylcarbamoyl transferase component Bud32
MLSCPNCQTVYPDGVEICARDGGKLVAVAAVAAGARTSQSVPDFKAIDDSATLAARAPDAHSPSSPVASRAVPDHVGSGSQHSASSPDPPLGTDATFDSLVGATLAGRYLIVRRIGEGGMGAVYEAKHTIIGKRVAVKVLLEKFLTKTDFVARLLQEARLASAIGHEHIVDVTDFGTTDDGRAFVAMEFLDGESLAQLVMREAPLPVERSLRIARQVASALGAAHAKGIVHRDVKPENVYLIRRGEADFVKVVDFGISKAVKQGQGDDTPDYRLTHTGLLLGTPLYMSPEQARGDEDLDHRVDVWAMGVMLYECLTGEVPFRANNYLGIISQVLTHTPLPPSRLRPELGIPEAVETVVMRAMEKDRSRRYAAMADVERDLERLLAGDQNVGAGFAVAPTAAAPHGSPRSRIWVWGAAVAALVVGVAMVLARPDRSGEAPAIPAAHATGNPPTGDPGRPGDPGPPAIAGPAQRTLAATPPVAVGLPSGSNLNHTLQKSPRVDVAVRRDGSPGARPSSRKVASPTRRLGRTRQAVDDSDRVDRSRARPSDEPVTKADDPVIRGALPSRSGEGYPDN